MPTRMQRLYLMSQEISKSRYPSVDRFCRMFEVKPRTVYEDIKTLREEIGMDVVYDRYKDGYYVGNPNKSLPTFELSNAEVFALTLGKNMLSEYTGTAVETLLKSALEKIQDRLPEDRQAGSDDVTPLVKFDPIGLIPLSWNIFGTLNTACQKKNCVALTYYAASSGETTKRKVDPYKLLENRATWYLVANCHMRKGMRLFALHRIKELQLLDEHFEVREDFDIDAWLDSAFLLEHHDDTQMVKIHFRPTAARYIREREWHSTQTLIEHTDGSCTMNFQTISLDETKRWVLAYGSEAQVLEPPVLRNLVIRELTFAIEKYQE